MRYSELSFASKHVGEPLATKEDVLFGVNIEIWIQNQGSWRCLESEENIGNIAQGGDEIYVVEVIIDNKVLVFNGFCQVWASLCPLNASEVHFLSAIQE